MTFKTMPTIVEEAVLRNYLQEALEDLPNNLPQYDEMRLLGDLCFLFRSPLFLYAISPRLTPPLSAHFPLTPISITSDEPATAFDVTHLKIRIKWTDDNWVAQLSYCDNVLLEGRQLDVEREVGFVQSFFWFCEEASCLAYEFKAREHAWKVRRGESVDAEPLVVDSRVEVPERSKAGTTRRALKLKVRFRDTARGPAGVWRVE